MPLMMKLRSSFEEDRVQTRLRHVVASIEGGSTNYQLLDEESSRVFLREGDLVK